MLRQLAFSISTSCRFGATLPAASWTRFIQTGGGNAVTLPNPPPLSVLVNEHDNVLASIWTKAFAATNGRIPRELVELSFSRSSGPGGQNVNKVNTKATLRCSLNQPWIPRWAVPILVKDTHYVASTHSILVTSTVHRSQAQNIEECLSKLHAMVLAAASKPIKHGPSEEQKKKVEGLVKAEKTRRKLDKMHRSNVKQGRSGKAGRFDF